MKPSTTQPMAMTTRIPIRKRMQADHCTSPGCSNESIPWGRRRKWLRPAVGIWAALVIASFAWLECYSYTPGSESAPSTLDAAHLPFPVANGKYLLVMAVHPKCPCSQASLGEMSRLLAQHASQLQCVLLAYRPRSSEPDWIDTNLVRTARRTPGISVYEDIDGQHAKQLGMLTSGATVLYSPSGAVEYHGGITSSRGHWGDSDGSDAIRSIINGKTPPVRDAPVFGCQIAQK
jgi:hypothetical protein